MKVALFKFISTPTDSDRGELKRVQTAMNRFLSSGVQIQYVAQSSAACDNSPVLTVVTVFYEEAPAGKE